VHRPSIDIITISQVISSGAARPLVLQHPQWSPPKKNKNKRNKKIKKLGIELVKYSGFKKKNI